MASEKSDFQSELPVLIIDDFALNRECLSHYLLPHFAHIRGAWDLPSFFRETECTVPRLVLLNFGSQNSANLLQASLDLEPEPKVIVFGLSEEWDVVACAESGAAGLLLRSESFDQLVGLMREVCNGQAHCSAEVSSVLLGKVYATVGGRIQGDPAASALTARESEILRLVEDGLTNQQIAARLSLTVHTVKNHVHSLLGKLGVGSRAAASRVARAMRYSGPVAVGGTALSR